MLQSDHPSPTLDRLTQYGGLALVGIMLAACGGQIALGLSGAGVGLLLITGLLTLGLIAPVMMLTAATPAVTVDADGITLRPHVWPERRIPWQAVREIKPYPLLPPRDAEMGRRALVGRRSYRPAEGKMLVIPSLGLPYRFTGFFAGEGFTGVIALTNRTHSNYESLIRTVEQYYAAARAEETAK